MKFFNTNFCILEATCVLSVVDIPDDKLKLYKSVIPSFFKMPRQPKVLLYFLHNKKMASDSHNPYFEAGVCLRVGLSNYNEEGWHVLNMAVSEEVAYKLGKLGGYPKYIPESLVLENNNGSWVGKVKNGGKQFSVFNFNKREIEVPWQEKYQFIDPFFLPVQNDLRVHIMKVEFMEVDVFNRSTGVSTFKIDTGEEWGNLIPGEDLTFPGILEEFSGKCCLMMMQIKL